MPWISAGRRTLWLRLHRWLGLGLGAVFVLLGLTGSLLVFYTEIDQAIEPRLAVPGPEPVVASWQRVLEALQRGHPQRDGPWRIELPPEDRGLVTARYLKPAETAGHHFAPLLVSVNPQTGEVLASRFWGSFAATWVFDLHYSLLAGDVGVTVVGVLGLLFTASLVAGLVLWWPRRGQWRAALRFKLDASAQRRHYDLHKAMGLGGSVVLLVLALTGFALALPSVVAPVFRAMGTPLPIPTVSVAREAGRPLIGLDDAIAITRRHWPESVPRWVDTPTAGSALYRVRTWLPGDPSRRFPRSYVWVHGHSGAVLAVRDARQQSVGDTVQAWLHPLHNGEAFGLAGRVLACIAGLVPLGLAVTGWLRWRDRRRGRRSRARRPVRPDLAR